MRSERQRAGVEARTGAGAAGLPGVEGGRGPCPPPWTPPCGARRLADERQGSGTMVRTGWERRDGSSRDMRSNGAVRGRETGP